MLLSLSLIPKDFKKPLMPLNSPLIHLGKDAIKRIIPLKIYAIALNELLRNVCTIDNLMPIVLNKIDTAVRAISAVIQLFRISIKDTSDTVFNTDTKNATNMSISSNLRNMIKNNNFVLIISLLNKFKQLNILILYWYFISLFTFYLYNYKNGGFRIDLFKWWFSYIWL